MLHSEIIKHKRPSGHPRLVWPRIGNELVFKGSGGVELRNVINRLRWKYSLEDILLDYPQLKKSDVLLARSYYNARAPAEYWIESLK